MKRITMTVIGLVVAAMAAPSFAADLPRPSYKAPIYTAPGFSWTGFYVGLNAGYGFGKADWSGGGVAATNPKGFLGGGQVGYNLQTGYWVWGLEADFDYNGMKGDATDSGTCAFSCETKSTWFGTARGRIGYAGWDRWMPYLTGGAAFGDIKMTNTFGSAKETKIGWTLGGGVEYALWSNWSTKLEYLYADLGSASCDAATCGLASDVKYTANIVRLGVNYRF
jgi:outer membrane immunogenic protein